MKKSVLLLLLCCSLFEMSAQTLTGFYGFRFGCSVDSIKKVMLAKPGCLLDQKYSNENLLIFGGTSFAGREVVLMKFSFINGKFHTGSVYFDPKMESKTISFYKEIRDELNEKYFKSKQDFEIYKTPYEKGDGYTESAIKLGKATFATYWSFKNPKQKSDEGNNIISLEINERLRVVLAYQDGVLFSESAEKDKSKNFKDY